MTKDGKGKFYPNRIITRAEMAKAIYTYKENREHTMDLRVNIKMQMESGMTSMWHGFIKKELLRAQRWNF